MFEEGRQSLESIVLYYGTSKKALNLYKKNIIDGTLIDTNYIGLKKEEVVDRFHFLLDELDKTSSLNILSNLEAAFRTDYKNRIKKRLKDPVSRKMKALDKSKGDKVSLESDILKIWKEENSIFKPIVSDFISAFKYRHWLAHGRFWTPKLGKKYDFETVYIVSEKIYKQMPLRP